ncbi:MAG: hypothetical protein GX817_00225 [Elusimicrobia bacterium]|nr:hypothetical protein [Elusimicrobiota bacterium]
MLNRNFIFITALIVGLIFGDKIDLLSFLNIPILIFIMVVAMTETDFSQFRDLKKVVRPFVAGVLLNYFFLFAVLLILGKLFMVEGDLWSGLVIAAASPPGLAIMPFTALVGGSMFLSTVATFSAFIASLVFTPFLSSFFTGGELIGYFEIFKLFFLTLVLPVIIGIGMRKIGFADLAKRIHGNVVNIGFGVIFAIITGVNRSIVFENPGEILRLLIIFIIAVYGVAYLFKYILSKTNIDRKTAMSIIIVVSIKNSIFGAAAAYQLVGPLGAAPGTLFTFVTLSYLMFIEKIVAFK